MFRVISSDFKYAQFGREPSSIDDAWNSHYNKEPMFRVFGEKDNIEKEDGIGDGYDTYDEAVQAAQTMLFPGHYDFVVIKDVKGNEVKRFAEERPHAPEPMLSPQPMITPRY